MPYARPYSLEIPYQSVSREIEPAAQGFLFTVNRSPLMALADHEPGELGSILELLEPQHRVAQSADPRFEQRLGRQLLKFFHDIAIGGELLLAAACRFHRALHLRAVPELYLHPHHVAEF